MDAAVRQEERRERTFELVGVGAVDPLDRAVDGDDLEDHRALRSWGTDSVRRTGCGLIEDQPVEELCTTVSARNASNTALNSVARSKYGECPASAISTTRASCRCAAPALMSGAGNN